MNYNYRAAPVFWKNFHKLSSEQKDSTRRAFKIFKVNPFDSVLGTHKIHALSAKANKTVYSVFIENNLRAVFYIDGNTVYTFDIGSHDVYK